MDDQKEKCNLEYESFLIPNNPTKIGSINFEICKIVDATTQSYLAVHSE